MTELIFRTLHRDFYQHKLELAYYKYLKKVVEEKNYVLMLKPIDCVVKKLESENLTFCFNTSDGYTEGVKLPFFKKSISYKFDIFLITNGVKLSDDFIEFKNKPIYSRIVETLNRSLFSFNQSVAEIEGKIYNKVNEMKKMFPKYVAKINDEPSLTKEQREARLNKNKKSFLRFFRKIYNEPKNITLEEINDKYGDVLKFCLQDFKLKYGKKDILFEKNKEDRKAYNDLLIEMKNEEVIITKLKLRVSTVDSLVYLHTLKCNGDINQVSQPAYKNAYHMEMQFINNENSETINIFKRKLRLQYEALIKFLF